MTINSETKKDILWNECTEHSLMWHSLRSALDKMQAKIQLWLSHFDLLLLIPPFAIFKKALELMEYSPWFLIALFKLWEVLQGNTQIITKLSSNYGYYCIIQRKHQVYFSVIRCKTLSLLDSHLHPFLRLLPTKEEKEEDWTGPRLSFGMGWILF